MVWQRCRGSLDVDVNVDVLVPVQIQEGVNLLRAGLRAEMCGSGVRSRLELVGRWRKGKMKMEVPE